MHLNSLYDRDGCPELASCPVVSCPGSCDLKTQSCSIVAESCPSTCEAIRCDPLPNQSSGGSGPSPGTLAGAVIAALLFLGLVVLGYLYYRRREKAKEAAAREKANADAKPDIPACADTVLSRPDPHLTTRASIADASEKPPTLTRADSGDATELGIVRVYSNHSDTTIDLDPSREAPRQPPSPSTRSNPFADGASIQTTSDRSQSTNVIPIALVPPGGHAPETLSQSRAGTPIRPARSPEVTLNDTYTTLDHAVVSDSDVDEVRAPYTGSTRSGISGKSFMTTSSLATDLDESTIMTPKQGVIRQVFGMSQAQVVRVPSSASSTGRTNSANYSGNVRGPRSKPTSRMSKATLGRSPLAQQSFTPADIPLTNRESLSPPPVAVSRADPFSDESSPHRASFADSSRSTDTFGSPTEYNTEGPFTPRPGATFADVQSSRPVSVASTADGVSIRADISTASRVMLGMQSPSAFSGSTLSPGYNQSRATSMQTNSGRTFTSVDRDDDDESVRPHSILSAKTTSSRADSVLAGFPFVPPSPISALPPRSPGTSPNASPSSTGSMFAKQQALSRPATNSPPASPTPTGASQRTVKPREVTQHQPPRPPLPPVPRPNYKPQAAERAPSTFSTSTSSGLETYPFQFGSQEAASPSAQLRRPSRASLDTLALSRDLAAFPLEFESPRYVGNGKLGK